VKMTKPNIGWLFYKAYYQNKNIVWKETTDKDKEKNNLIFSGNNKQIFQQTLPETSPYLYPKKTGEGEEGFKTFDLKTTYPGLLIGTGYTHGTNLFGELKIGFYFDHTTGLPIIPGSSVKGLLRSMFPMQDQQRAVQKQNQGNSLVKEQKLKEAEKCFDESKQYDESKQQKEAFIQSLLLEKQASINIYELERQIFGNANGDDNSRGRDIFHDAILVKSEHPKRNGFPKGCFLADDYLTPHKNTKKDGIPDALKNPIPISLLKVLPNVTFCFQFDLKNHYLVKKEDGTYDKKDFLLNAQERVDLFKKIIEYIGIGAKTNVGYGQLQ